jgi:hypothetical protein
LISLFLFITQASAQSYDEYGGEYEDDQQQYGGQYYGANAEEDDYYRQEDGTAPASMAMDENGGMFANEGGGGGYVCCKECPSRNVRPCGILEGSFMAFIISYSFFAHSILASAFCANHKELESENSWLDPHFRTLPGPLFIRVEQQKS